MQVFCGLYFVSIVQLLLSKNKMPTVVSFAAIVWSHHAMPSIPCWMMRPNNGCKRDYAYSHSSNRKKIKIICLQLVTSKI